MLGSFFTEKKCFNNHQKQIMKEKISLCEFINS